MNFPHSYHCFCFMCSSALSGSNPNSLAWSQYPQSLFAAIVSSLLSHQRPPKIPSEFPQIFVPWHIGVSYLRSSTSSFKIRTLSWTVRLILKAGLNSGLIGFQGLLLSFAQAFFTLLLAHLHSSLYSEISENQNFIVNWTVPSLSHIWIVVEVQWIFA